MIFAILEITGEINYFRTRIQNTNRSCMIIITIIIIIIIIIIIVVLIFIIIVKRCCSYHYGERVS